LLQGQDQLRVSKRLLKRLPFGLNTMMFSGHLLESGGGLGQGAEDAQEITIGHGA
jgi:hypothetical protein